MVEAGAGRASASAARPSGGAVDEPIVASTGVPEAVVVQRRAMTVPTASPVSRADRGPARGMTQHGRITIPAAVGSLEQGTGRAVLAHEQVHVRQQQALGDRLPSPGSESAHRLESEARHAEAVVAWEEMTLARPSTRPVVDSSAARAISRPMEAATRSVGQGDPEMTAPGDRTPDGLQFADGDAPAPAPSVTTAGTPTGGTGPGNPSDRDLDEMLRRLYPRMRRQLSSELLVARERAGVLADRR